MARFSRYCLDSNAVSDVLRGRGNVKQKMEENINLGNFVAMCSIVYYEVERGLKSIGATRKLSEFYNLYSRLNRLYFDRENIDAVAKSADIYVKLHRGQQIEDNDIYIAAIAMVNDCTLITSNTAHFERVEGLKIANWRN